MRNSVVIAGFVLASMLPQASFAADAARPKEVTAQDLAKTPPSATFEFEGSQFLLIVGGGSGKGILRFQGKEYPFTAKGVSVGVVGATAVKAAGDVHYLQKIEDFAGQYNGVAAGIAVGPGKGSSTFENSKGVVISVRSRAEGFATNLGVNSFSVQLAK